MEGSGILITLLGGVGLLLWSVRMIRTGMTRAFGASLRALLARACSNRVKAFTVGTAITGLLQSSTAMALMLASFTSRKLIALPLALAVMLGADVGTALVALVYSVDVKWLWAPLLFLGVVLFNASEGDRARGAGRMLIGLGLMLLGLTIIGQLAAQMGQSPTLKLILSSLGTEQIPLLAVLAMAALTWLSHSSLAMVLFIMSLAGGGLIDHKLTVALVLGVNLGAAIVPFVALLGSSPMARQVVLGNLLVRGGGAMLALPFTAYIATWLGAISPNPSFLAVNFHFLFNATIALLALPLVNPLAKLATRIIPGTRAGAGQPREPKHLDPSLIDTPSEALASAMRETLSMGDIVFDMLKKSLPAIEGSDVKAVKEIESTDDDVDSLHEAIKHYLVRTSKADLGEEDSRRYMEILSFTTNLEHIGDIIDKNLMELATKKIKKQYAFSPEGTLDLREFHGQVVDNFQLALNVFATRDIALARRLLQAKANMRSADFRATDQHFARLKEGRPESIETSAIHLDIVRDLKRINSHLTAVAYPILEAAGELTPSRLRDARQLQNSPVL
jgi:phosphate:Na+ symporter